MKKIFTPLLLILYVGLICLHFGVFNITLKSRLHEYNSTRLEYGLLRIPNDVCLRTYRLEKTPIFFFEYEKPSQNITVKKTISLPVGSLTTHSGESDSFEIGKDSTIVIWHTYWNKKMEYILWVNRNKSVLTRQDCYNILHKYGINMDSINMQNSPEIRPVAEKK